jgi:hypothetical protein
VRVAGGEERTAALEGGAERGDVRGLERSLFREKRRRGDEGWDPSRGQESRRAWRDRSRRHTRGDVVPRRIPGSGSPRARSCRALGAPRTRGRTHPHPPPSRRRTPSSSPPPPPSSPDARSEQCSLLQVQTSFLSSLSTAPTFSRPAI